MDIRDMLRLLNIITALITLPASIYLLKVAIEERKVVESLEHKLNTILIVLFMGVGIGSILNALISLIVILGNGAVAHEAAPYRTVMLNLFFSFIAWALYLFHKKISEK